MRVEFRQGVPKGCIAWLWENIGRGNIYPGSATSASVLPGKILASSEKDLWKYERVAIPKTPESFGDDPFSYVPTITVYDEKSALMFALRWS